jgi:hypothetical protein
MNLSWMGPVALIILFVIAAAFVIATAAVGITAGLKSVRVSFTEQGKQRLEDEKVGREIRESIEQGLAQRPDSH